MFYRFLKLEERADAAAVELLGSPALWERIPTILSPESVEKLLAAPLPADRFYLRDRALLETLYATGCRASEVVHLKVGDLYLDGDVLQGVRQGEQAADRPARVEGGGRPADLPGRGPAGAVAPPPRPSTCS